MQSINWETIRQVDLVDYLAFLGHRPDTKMSRNHQYWYLSPLPGRNEKTPSFKIDRKKNLWYDHGLGKGGSIIDFCVQYHGCAIAQVLDKLHDFFSFHRILSNTLEIPEPSGHLIPTVPTHFSNEKKKIQVLMTGHIASPALLHYLEQRKIPIEIAQKYCKEVQYELGSRKYYAIGFPTDAGGYELRNAYFKGSSSPKGITFFDNGMKDVYVFEGFFDFLSFAVIRPQTGPGLTNCLVLNSLSFFEKSRSLMEQHNKIFLFLDRGPSGRQNTKKTIAWNKEIGLAKYTDNSDLYKYRDDLNAWLVDQSRQQQQQVKRGGRGL